jgi:fatty-acyl-CoA synthase
MIQDKHVGMSDLSPEIRRATAVTVGALVRKQARLNPQRIAVEFGAQSWTFAAFNTRANQAANALAGLGVARGDRIAFLSRNHPAYLELLVAAAKLGAIVASLNWRQADPELAYCIRLVAPKLLIALDDMLPRALKIDHGVTVVMSVSDFAARQAAAPAQEPPEAAEAEDGLVILYTSGTTGHPKAAVISQRAAIARMAVSMADWDHKPEDVFIAWAPYFHMASTDPSLASLMLGAKTIVCDGPEIDTLLDIAERERLNRLVLFPGMIGKVIERVKERRPKVVDIRSLGVIPDLVPPHQIAEITALLGAPYSNTFGSTEGGAAPASGNRIAIGVVPETLGKLESAFCDVRLVDTEGKDVPDGKPGECLLRGPTLFSGYYGAPEVNAQEFRDGWFHTGDVFIRAPDGLLHFVDRVKYLIKTGGENVYPAEIERVVLADPGVIDAVVVRRRDAHWGEVPVLLVARRSPAVTAESLIKRCTDDLARYKRPKEVVFVETSDFLRSETGKIKRHEMEVWLEARRPPFG